jgi:hypothetical protein
MTKSRMTARGARERERPKNEGSKRPEANQNLGLLPVALEKWPSRWDVRRRAASSRMPLHPIRDGPSWYFDFPQAAGSVSLCDAKGFRDGAGVRCGPEFFCEQRLGRSCCSLRFLSGATGEHNDVRFRRQETCGR